MTLFAILVVLLFLTFNYFLKRDFAYPPFIYSAVWLIIFILEYLVEKYQIFGMNKISSLTIIILLAGIFAITLGGYSAFLSLNDYKNKSSHKPRKLIINKQYDFFLFLLPIIILPLYINRAFEISENSGISNFFIGLRFELENEYGQKFGILKYIIPFTTFNLIYRFILYNLNSSSKKIKFEFYSSLIITFTYLIFTTGRTHILFFLCSLLGIKLINEKINLKQIVFVFIVFTFSFYVFALILSKGGSFDLSFKENLKGISEIFLWYAVSGIKAFNSFFNSTIIFEWGENSFRFFYAVLYKLGLIQTQPVKLVQPFVFIPLPTNVYTIYYTYIKDFGSLICMMLIFIYSTLHSVIYFVGKKGRIGPQYFYSILLYPLIMSFFQDQYLSLLSTWIQFSLFYIVTFKIFGKIHYKDLSLNEQ